MCGLPNWLEVTVERDAGPSYRVALQGRTLAYARWEGDGTRTITHVQPAPQAWRDFLTALEAVDLWHWQPDYTADGVPAPGLRWYIEIVAPGRQVNTSGTNALPAGDRFPRCCAALRALLGGLEIH